MLLCEHVSEIGEKFFHNAEGGIASHYESEADGFRRGSDLKVAIGATGRHPQQRRLIEILKVPAFHHRVEPEYYPRVGIRCVIKRRACRS